jgi:hypothetical protein
MMKPSPALLVKLGSIIVHFDEATEPGAHEFDLHTARQLLADPEVAAWMKAMTAAAMLPVKRSTPARAKVK